MHKDDPKDKVKHAIADLRQGRLVVVRDHESREDEGDLVCAAERCTPQNVNFMVTHGRGLLCVPMTSERARSLKLPPMATQNTEAHRCKFTVSVDYAHGTASGISADDRSKTIQALADPMTKSGDLRRPGHVFPLVAAEGGLAERDGHTEASVELMRLAGLQPVAAICEILKDDGSMMRGDDLSAFCERWGLVLLSIDDILRVLSCKHEGA
jgi:3,4-dihydroxy 2-butanone 4-phosphate synthase/GTP cyclohydrolase II